MKNKVIKLGVFGSRTLNDRKSTEFIEYQIKEFMASHKISHLIVPGDIKGACEVAIDVARETQVPIMLFFYNKGTSKGRWKMINSIQKRTKHIVDTADFFLVFHDGKSKGTMWDLKQIIKAGKPYKYIKVKVKKQDEMDIVDIDVIDIEEVHKEGL